MYFLTLNFFQSKTVTYPPPTWRRRRRRAASLLPCACNLLLCLKPVLVRQYDRLRSSMLNCVEDEEILTTEYLLFADARTESTTFLKWSCRKICENHVLFFYWNRTCTCCDPGVISVSDFTRRPLIYSHSNAVIVESTWLLPSLRPLLVSISAIKYILFIHLIRCWLINVAGHKPFFFFSFYCSMSAIPLTILIRLPAASEDDMFDLFLSNRHLWRYLCVL